MFQNIVSAEKVKNFEEQIIDEPQNKFNHS